MKNKVDVRFVAIKPKTPRLKLPNRLFQPEQTGPTRILRPRAEPRSLPLGSFLPNLSFPTRIMSALIGATCIVAGLAMIVHCVRNGKWLLALSGPFGIVYGIAWVRIAQEGWLPGGRLRLNPWGKE